MYPSISGGRPSKGNHKLKKVVKAHVGEHRFRSTDKKTQSIMNSPKAGNPAGRNDSDRLQIYGYSADHFESNRVTAREIAERLKYNSNHFATVYQSEESSVEALPARPAKNSGFNCRRHSIQSVHSRNRQTRKLIQVQSTYGQVNKSYKVRTSDPNLQMANFNISVLNKDSQEGTRERLVITHHAHETEMGPSQPAYDPSHINIVSHNRMAMQQAATHTPVITLKPGLVRKGHKSGGKNRHTVLSQTIFHPSQTPLQERSFCDSNLATLQVVDQSPFISIREDNGHPLPSAHTQMDTYGAEHLGVRTIHSQMRPRDSIFQQQRFSGSQLEP